MVRRSTSGLQKDSFKWDVVRGILGHVRVKASNGIGSAIFGNIIGEVVEDRDQSMVMKVFDPQKDGYRVFKVQITEQG